MGQKIGSNEEEIIFMKDKEIEFKKKVRLVIMKVVMIDGVAYHTNCGIKTKEDICYMKKIDGEVIINETSK